MSVSVSNSSSSASLSDLERAAAVRILEHIKFCDVNNIETFARAYERLMHGVGLRGTSRLRDELEPVPAPVSTSASGLVCSAVDEPVIRDEAVSEPVLEPVQPSGELVDEKPITVDLGSRLSSEAMLIQADSEVGV
jgi:hypothetical protein